MSVHPTILVSSQDFDRLQELMTAALDPNADRLDLELERARVIEPGEVPPNLVTMNSQVTYESLESGERHTVRLVYPRDADVADKRISILAPLGSALLGLSEGQEIGWVMPGGVRKIRALKVVYQPEAAGDWHL